MKIIQQLETIESELIGEFSDDFGMPDIIDV